MVDDTSVRTVEPDGNEEYEILVCVENARNRRLLTEWLDGTYHVTAGYDETQFERSFDLCVLDERAFGKYRTDLQEQKVTAAPTFLPYLLLARPETLERSGPWDQVDEVVIKPAKKRALAMRIRRLLEQRRLSTRLEAERRRTESRFRTLFEALPDPAFVMDKDGRIRSANDAFTHQTGISVDDEALVDEFLPGETVSELHDTLGRGDEGMRLAQTTSYTTATARTRVAELHTKVALRTDDGTESVGVFRDITERTQKDEELERQNRRLDEFASMLAHEIRNPLSIAQIHLNVAREDGEGESFETVEDALNRIERMVDELLALAQQGNVVGEYEVVNLGRTAEHAWESMGETNPKAALDVSDVDWWIAADGNRLREVFENLFRNAIEHGTAGRSTDREDPDEVEVTIRVGRISDGNEGRGFFVADDGPGIPQAKRDSVFDRGFTSRGAGTGLGLPVVKQIVEAHGWTIHVTDSEDGGTRFDIRGIDQ